MRFNLLNKMFYFLGIDPIIVCFELISMKSDNNIENSKWVRSIQLVAHSVEVRSLVHFKSKLFSGGNYKYTNIYQFLFFI